MVPRRLISLAWSALSFALHEQTMRGFLLGVAFGLVLLMALLERRMILLERHVSALGIEDPVPSTEVGCFRSRSSCWICESGSCAIVDAVPL